MPVWAWMAGWVVASFICLLLVHVEQSGGLAGFWDDTRLDLEGYVYPVQDVVLPITDELIGWIVWAVVALLVAVFVWPALVVYCVYMWSLSLVGALRR